jgi:hypothetical protein
MPFVIEPKDIVFSLMPPGRVIEESRQLGRIVVSEHPEDVQSGGPKAFLGEKQPPLEALSHQLDEDLVY